MGSCHPNGSLYEKPLDLRAAQLEHMRFREELERNGCVVRTVREILAQDCDVDVVAREKLEDLAMDSMAYKLIQSHGGLDLETLTSTEAHLLSDEYKKSCIEKMDVEQLVEVILTRPTILLEKADKDTELLVVNYTYEPLVNLIFCRDQQITTARGVVMGRPRSRIRQREVEVMKFCFEKLGVPIIGNVTAPGTLEGGDFFPAGVDLAMVGVGLRSNMDAVRYLLDNDLFGTERVAVVKDYFDQHQQRMHLDTVFNIIGPKVCIMLSEIQGKESPLRRLVDEYKRDPATGKYVVHRHDIEFLEYVEGEGYHVITLTNDMQIAYGCNGLNLGNNTLVTVDRMTAKFIARTPGFSGKIKVVDFSNNTNMFGSVHCCSQVISRRPPTPAELAQKKPMVPPSPTRPLSPVSALASSASLARPANVPRRLMMVAPNNFDVNQKTAQDNLLMAASHERFIKKLHQKGQGRRDVHAALVSEFAELHRVLTVKIGASVHLFTHEIFHQTPDALFAADWFVTHREEENGNFPAKGQNGLVLLPMKTDTRQHERRPDLVAFLSEKYRDIINLSACEAGSLVATKSIESSSSAAATSSGPCKPLEGSSFVMDRRTRTAFAARTCTRLDMDAFQLWAKETGYSTVIFDLDTESNLPNANLLKSMHHTRILLGIFSNFSFVCEEAIAPADRAKVVEALSRNGQTVFKFTLAQIAGLAVTGSFEVFSREGKSILIVSQAAFASFTEEQKKGIAATGTTFEVVNMTETEQLGGGSVSGVIASLF